MWRDEAYLLDILLAAKKILEFVGNSTQEEFKANELLQSAVLRQFEILGEAANRLSEELKEKHSNIPWYEIVGMRNRLIHEYFRVNLDMVWEAIQKDIPKLIDQIKPLVPPE